MTSDGVTRLVRLCKEGDKSALDELLLPVIYAELAPPPQTPL
jgi:hypothetical protein